MAVVKNMIIRVGADMSGLISGFKKGAGATGSFAKQAESALRAATLSPANLKKQMARSGKNDAIVSLVDQIRELEAEQKALKDAGFSWGFEGFEENEALLRDLKNQLKEYIASLQKAGEETDETSHKTNRLGNAAKSVKERLKEAGSRLHSIGRNAKSSSSGVDGLVRTIKKFGLVAIGLRLTRAVFGELQSIVSRHISENAALQAQVTALRNSFGQALAPAINLVTNALSLLMPYIVGVSNAIGSLISNLFGSGWTALASGADAAKDSISGASGAQEEMNRQLMGFDQINKLNSKSGGGGGDGGSETTPINGTIPEWMVNLTDKVKEAVRNGDWTSVGAEIANMLNLGIEQLSTSNLGQSIATWINNAVGAATGFITAANWAEFGNALTTQITELAAGIDWTQLFSGLGSLASGIGQFLGGAFSDIGQAIREYYAAYIEEAKAQLEGSDFTEPAVAIVNGIVVGTLTGIAEAFSNIGTWIYDNVLIPFVDGFKSAFNIHSPASNPLITDLGKNIILGILEGAKEAFSKPGEWVKKNFLEPLAKAFSGNKTGSSLSLEFQAQITSWKNELKDRSMSFKARITSWKNELTERKIKFQARMTTWKNELTERKIKFQARMTTWKNELTERKIKFQARMTTWKNELQNKSVGFQAKLTTWKDTLQNKVLTFKANVTKGWAGNIGDALGISSIVSKLSLKTPSVEIDWGTVTALGATFRYPKGFSLKWNAMGAILNGAQIFGRAGNTLLGGGEAGREAVLPLDRNTWWMDKIADRVALRVSGGGQRGEQNITINLTLDGKIITSTVVRNVNAQARATGKNPLAAYL